MLLLKDIMCFLLSQRRHNLISLNSLFDLEESRNLLSDDEVVVKGTSGNGSGRICVPRLLRCEWGHHQRYPGIAGTLV